MSQQQKLYLNTKNDYFFNNNYLNQNNTQRINFQGGMNTMIMTGFNPMNMNQTNANPLRMTYMNQSNNPLLSNTTMMPNNFMNTTYFKKNNDEEEKYVGQTINGLKNGKGTLYYKNGSLKYQGDFVYDIKFLCHS